MTDSKKPSNEINNNELSLKDLIFKFQNWMQYLWSKKILIIFFSLLSAGCFLTYSLFQKPSYQAELTFILEDTKSSPLGNYANIASQFGFNLGGGSGSGVFSGDNILAFLKSRYIINKTLLSPISANKDKSMADLYLEISQLRKSWESHPELNNISFPPTYKPGTSILKDSVLSILYNNLLKLNLDVDKLDKKLSFITVSCKSPDQTFSKIFIEALVKEATQFYINTKVQKYTTSIESLQSRADSLELLLNRKTSAVAASEDLNLNPAKKVALVGVELANRDKMVAQTMYSEVVKNLEITKFSMTQETPIIQIIDTPILPLKKTNLGKAKALIIGGFVGGLLSIICLMAVRIYKEIIN
ncbi:lipopolysaccharide biosynthesis protein [Chitinophaga silvatica]|uniref:Lipopolysaccharide biosynthesis protein n=1 Tax=Chitinophaga silvatica TaxID=2282649 RepID=A0A3E1YCB7_9BACT|nr:lipopolysaccharide biosynthesis protein [Chitinophaga silvatica]RFS23943.1 lipopolysaccharide biosynthesis protein [Chitinophaga silvatica]